MQLTVIRVLSLLAFVSISACSSSYEQEKSSGTAGLVAKSLDQLPPCSDFSYPPVAWVEEKGRFYACDEEGTWQPLPNSNQSVKVYDAAENELGDFVSFAQNAITTKLSGGYYLRFDSVTGEIDNNTSACRYVASDCSGECVVEDFWLPGTIQLTVSDALLAHSLSDAKVTNLSTAGMLNANGSCVASNSTVANGRKITTSYTMPESITYPINVPVVIR